jgi:hypothetical protein
MIGLLIIMIPITFAIVAAAAVTFGVDSRELDVNSHLS